MKTPLLFFLVLAVSALASAPKEEDLARAELVRVWDLRTSDMNARPTEIKDPKIVAALVDTLKSAPGDWREGSFTMPTGYLMLGFWRGSHVIARIGLGEGFLVRGSMEQWESKKITKELEAILSALAQKKQPNSESCVPR